ncbi:MAG: response regulator [bacterium]
MSKKRILLAEDDRFILEMYAEKLQANGHKVDLAEDGATAIELAEKNTPDLIMLDIIMPKKDGFEVLASLKKDKKLEKVPVILLTNLGQRQNIEKGLKMGATDYIIKVHFTPAEVISKMEAVLEKK